MKLCSKCKKERPLSEYRKFKRAPDGLSYWCKGCFGLWENEHKEQRLARQRTPEYREMRRKWRITHNISARSREYHQKRYEDKKVEIRKKMDEWRANNLDKWNGYSRKRRAMVKGVKHIPYLGSDIYDRDKGICGICHEPIDIKLKHPALKSFSIDHIVPIALGGDDTPENVQAAHFNCNARKAHRV